MPVKLVVPIRNNITIMKFDRDGITEIVLKNCQSQIMKKYFGLIIRDNKQSGLHICIHYLKKSFKVYIRIKSDILLSETALDNI
ncbi:hypothetical protein B6C99_10670 [Gilliamella sp. N-G2]|nr:hypothetical protein B6C99_10670 [Gilliamella sp. N-G2]